MKAAVTIPPFLKKAHKRRSGIIYSDYWEDSRSFNSDAHFSQFSSENWSQQGSEKYGKKKDLPCVDNSSVLNRRKSLSGDLNTYFSFYSWRSGDYETSTRRAVSADAESFPQVFRKSFIICQHYVNINSILKFQGEPQKGVSGLLHQCYLRSSGEARTCRVISKSSLIKLEDVEDLREDIRILRMLQPNSTILKLSGVYEDSKCVYILSEECPGETLERRMREKITFSEKEAAIITSQLASALAFSHRMGIMHRDLKPMKILMASTNSDTDIRLADFGSAACFEPGKKLKQLIGSPLYIAPSVLQHNYGTEADLWSLGVIVYMLLAGVPPFTGRNSAELFRNIQHGRLNLNIQQLASLSEEGKKILSLLLSRDPKDAISATAVLEHPWIVKHCPQIPPMERSPVASKTERISNTLETPKPAKVYSMASEATERRRRRRHSIGSVLSGELKASVVFKSWSRRMSFSGDRRCAEPCLSDESKSEDDTLCEAVLGAPPAKENYRATKSYAFVLSKSGEKLKSMLNSGLIKLGMRSQQ